jgi:trimeric autotransporter adhesin
MERRISASPRGSQMYGLAGALLVAALMAWAAPTAGQQDAAAGSSSSPTATTTDQAAGSVVPRLIEFSGVVKDATGKVHTGAATLTFSLYQEQESGRPLWVETQTLELDEQGRYTVLLGATQPEGMPLDLFSSGKARWLGVTPQLSAVGEQPRVLLVGVPYALKAADADTLGGKPASAFVTTDGQTSASQVGTTASTGRTGPTASAMPAPGAHGDAALSSTNQSLASVGGRGTTNYIPIWTSSTTLGNSAFFQTGGKVGLGTTAPGAKLEAVGGMGIGLRGSTTGINGGAVVGNATASSGGTTGVRGDSASTRGAGVVGNASATSGSTIGVLGEVASPNGIAGIFNNTAGGKILSGQKNGVEVFSVANSKSAVGLSAAGFNGASGSGLPGTDAIHATGGENDPLACFGGGGVGVVATGGTALNFPGAGMVAEGGYAFSCMGISRGADGIDATGGGGCGSGGAGVVASGGGGGKFGGGPGVMSTGASSGYAGPGVFAKGGSSTCGFVGDGIDAFKGCGCGGLGGFFSGGVCVTGNLTVSGTKSFRIDHPLDPLNKYLYHAALESSEVLNLYTGNVVLDANGEAAVQLPEWFEALNRDFRYHLTAIGAPAPNLHIAHKIQTNRFKIAGGSAGLEVSWQVTAVRQDAWEKRHPMAVEVQKPQRERGYYLNPELFGAPPEKSMDWARHPELMKRMKDIQEKQAKDAQARRAKPGKSPKPQEAGPGSLEARSGKP